MTDVSQKSTFLAGEGDAWHARNKSRLDEFVSKSVDPVVQILEDAKVRASRVLEIGCSNGWRLDILAKRNGGLAAGIDPSQQAVVEGRERYPELDLRRGSADVLPHESGSFDLVIYGFCLYLCDRSDLFRVVAEGDRVLADQGHLVIYDFQTTKPHRRVYHHDPRLMSYKLNNPGLFLANPAYQLVSQVVVESEGPGAADDCIAVTLLKKNLADAYPVRR